MRKHFLILVLLLLAQIQAQDTLSIQETSQNLFELNQDLQSEDNSQIHEQPQHEEKHYYTPSDPQFWETLGIALIFSVCGAFCSGMGVGLLSISKLELKMMINKKNDDDYRVASRILSVVGNHHLFLVTLLIANAISLESLPLVIHHLMPDWAAILTSTVIVLIAAEIIPQAVCTGPHKLTIAYYACPIILVMIKIFWILAYPIAKLLDHLIGDEHDEKIQHKDLAHFLNEDKFLKETEKMLLTSTLELRGNRVEDIMIHVEKSFMLDQNQPISQSIVKDIRKKAYSNILIYRGAKHRITGVMKAKEFAVKYLQSTGQLKPKDIMKLNSNILTVYRDTNLLQMMMLFQAKKTRIALVCNKKRKTDPDMKSIMYSKSDMIFDGEQESEVIGVIFLYQLFNQMTQLKEKIERESSVFLGDTKEFEMDTLGEHLLKR